MMDTDVTTNEQWNDIVRDALYYRALVRAGITKYDWYYEALDEHLTHKTMPVEGPIYD